MSAAVLAVAEHRRGDLRQPSLELLSAGRDLADAHGGELHVAVIGGDVEGFADQLDREGVDAVHTVAAGEEFNHDIWVQAIDALDADLDPGVLLFPNTVNGLDCAPAVAARLGRALVTDVIEIEPGDPLALTREMYGSKVETVVETDADRPVLTLRPGEWPAAEGTGDATIQNFAVEIDESAVRSSVTGFQEVGNGDVDITDADVLVSVGRGIGEEENLALVEALADSLGATLSSSRPIVDNGWLPANRQVGQSGKVVTPEVYIAVGISGAVQHVTGMKNADTIVAINTDPNAPIFDVADYAVVDDLFDVVPPLIEAFGGEPPEG